MFVSSEHLTFLATICILLIGIDASFKTMTTKDSNYLEEQHNKGKISDIKVNVTIYEERVPQLIVEWKDNLPNTTSYNVFAIASNPTDCPEMPCGVYGIAKPNSKQKLLIPERPMTFVDAMECSFVFGCNYVLTVETSNAEISLSKEISIPYCIYNVCSCQHARNLPIVEMNAFMERNDTINFRWSIDVNEWTGKNLTENEFRKKFDDINGYKLYLRVRRQTNPSLSWGGELIAVAESIYLLKNISNLSVSTNTILGNLTVKSNEELTPNTVLSLFSYIEDELRCAGPSNLATLKVPAFDEPNIELIKHFETASRSHTAWEFGIIVVVFIGTSLMIWVIWRRKRRLRMRANNKNDDLSSPLAMAFPMEDNLNYVDKYIEEAQAKGLADEFEIPHHAIELDTEIGEGAFGRVYRAIAMNLRRRRGATIVAVKQLKRNPTSDEIEEFLLEIEMLKNVGTHKNIVSFLGCCTVRPPYLMIMEHVGRGDLLTYLHNVRQYARKSRTNDTKISDGDDDCFVSSDHVKYIELKLSTQSSQSIEREPKKSEAETTYTILDDEPQFEYILDNKELHNFALQIANGMQFLEEQQITHRDLAARNVLINDNKILKISDFGLSRYGPYSNTKARKLPLRWLSIEAIRDNIYSNKSDVWAFGVVLWEIGTLGASPYPTISNHELIPYLISGKRLEKPQICTEQVYDIMLQCWDEDPMERPTFDELFTMLSPKTVYVDINSLSEDYVFPPIQRNDENTY